MLTRNSKLLPVSPNRTIEREEFRHQLQVLSITWTSVQPITDNWMSNLRQMSPDLMFSASLYLDNDYTFIRSRIIQFTFVMTSCLPSIDLALD